MSSKIFMRHSRTRKGYDNASNTQMAENVFQPSPFFPGLYLNPVGLIDTDALLFYACGGLRLERWLTPSGYFGERLVPYKRREYKGFSNGTLYPTRGLGFHYIRGVKGKTINIYANSWYGPLNGDPLGAKLNVPYAGGHMVLYPMSIGFSGGNAGDVAFPHPQAFGIPGQLDANFSGGPEGQIPSTYEGSMIREFYCEDDNYVVQLNFPETVFPGTGDTVDTNFMLIVTETAPRRASGQWTCPPVRRQILLGDPDVDGTGVMLNANTGAFIWPYQTSLWKYDTTQIGADVLGANAPWGMRNPFTDVQYHLVAETTDADTSAVDIAFGRPIMAKHNRRKNAPENLELATEVIYRPALSLPNDAAVPQTPRLYPNTLGPTEMIGGAYDRIGFRSQDPLNPHPYYIRGWLIWSATNGDAVEMGL